MTVNDPNVYRSLGVDPYIPTYSTSVSYGFGGGLDVGMLVSTISNQQASITALVQRCQNLERRVEELERQSSLHDAITIPTPVRRPVCAGIPEEFDDEDRFVDNEDGSPA